MKTNNLIEASAPANKPANSTKAKVFAYIHRSAKGTFRAYLKDEKSVFTCSREYRDSIQAQDDLELYCGAVYGKAPIIWEKGNQDDVNSFLVACGEKPEGDYKMEFYPAQIKAGDAPRMP